MNMFNGRWYAQRQLSCELCHVTKWKPAICGVCMSVCVCVCVCVRASLCVVSMHVCASMVQNF